MITIAYDSSGNPTQIIERIGTSWKVTIIYWNGLGLPIQTGEGEGWSFEDAYSLAISDISLRIR